MRAPIKQLKHRIFSSLKIILIFSISLGWIFFFIHFLIQYSVAEYMFGDIFINANNKILKGILSFLIFFLGCLYGLAIINGILIALFDFKLFLTYFNWNTFFKVLFFPLSIILLLSVGLAIGILGRLILLAIILLPIYYLFKPFIKFTIKKTIKK